jgi:hypothetical protein
VEYTKLDAALIAALEEVGDPDDQSLSVFVDVAPAARETALVMLAAMGVPAEGIGRCPVTATVSRRQVAELSQAPCVRQVRLASRLGLLDEG